MKNIIVSKKGQLRTLVLQAIRERKIGQLYLEIGYHQSKIVTKGRILGYTGKAGPQIDILILSPNYPNKLLDKKLYLAGGVLAAFECKLTLKTSHIEETVKNSILTKRLYKGRTGTPYKELHSPIIYGLLAHSHSWKGERSKPLENTELKLIEI